MKRILAITLVTLLGLTTSLRAGNTPEEASALVKAGVEFLKANGKDKAFEAFNNRQGPFVKGDLYLFVNGYDGTTLAHGGNDKLIGKNLSGLKDADGKAFIQVFGEKAKGGGGWVDYKWTNPNTKKVQDKSTYVVDLPGLNAYIGCGIYK